MLVKTTQYKSSGISSANLLRALEIFDLPPAISPELNKCPGSKSCSEQNIFTLVDKMFQHFSVLFSRLIDSCFTYLLNINIMET